MFSTSSKCELWTWLVWAKPLCPVLLWSARSIPSLFQVGRILNHTFKLMKSVSRCLLSTLWLGVVLMDSRLRVSPYHVTFPFLVSTSKVFLLVSVSRRCVTPLLWSCGIHLHSMDALLSTDTIWTSRKPLLEMRAGRLSMRRSTGTST